MKKAFKIIAGTFLIIVVSQGSLRSQSQWTYGLAGGLNLASMKITEVSGDPLQGDFGSRFSYNAGFFGEYGFNERMFFQLGFNIDQRGFTYKYSEQDNGADLTVKAPYFEVPLMFRYAFLNKDKFSLYAMAGPSFGFLIGGKIKGTRTDNGYVSDVDEKVSDTYTSSDLGIKVALGTEIPFADDQGAMFFDIRYYYGFTDNIRQAGYYKNTNLDANSQVLSFVIGVRGFVE